MRIVPARFRHRSRRRDPKPGKRQQHRTAKTRASHAMPRAGIAPQSLSFQFSLVPRPSLESLARER
jgi:hypothetical protein